ncbi:hypothetical protein TNCV_4133511 [Trichonephila clavipes]|uniref:Mos1 transposase HTH domain-containing protein n=1 Tax=Trichonephila clavipes TaxID=2585209 RepID=A0A8X6S6K5_TRICX|nr:hypothetical protein TNCV_4133511 [Trichonephila clavipes]
MREVWEECRINIKFLLKKPTSKTIQIFTEAYGDETLSRAPVLEWYKQFSGGKDSVKDDERAGHSSLRGSDKSGESSKGPSKNFVPELLPAMAARMQNCVNAEGNYFEGDNVTQNSDSVLQKTLIDLSEPNNIDSDAEIDSETFIKTVTFSNTLHGL